MKSMSDINPNSPFSRFCPNCRMSNPLVNLFCEHCGTQMLKSSRFESKSLEELKGLGGNYLYRIGLSAIFGLQSFLLLFVLQWFIPSITYLFWFGVLSLSLASVPILYYAWFLRFVGFYQRLRNEQSQNWEIISFRLMMERRLKRIPRANIETIHQKFIAMDPHFDELFKTIDKDNHRIVLYGDIALLLFVIVIPLKLVFPLEPALGIAAVLSLMPVYLSMGEIGRNTAEWDKVYAYCNRLKEEELIRDLVVYKAGRSNLQLRSCAISAIIAVVVVFAAIIT